MDKPTCGAGKLKTWTQTQRTDVPAQGRSLPGENCFVGLQGSPRAWLRSPSLHQIASAHDLLGNSARHEASAWLP